MDPYEDPDFKKIFLTPIPVWKEWVSLLSIEQLVGLEEILHHAMVCDGHDISKEILAAIPEYHNVVRDEMIARGNKILEDLVSQIPVEEIEESFRQSIENRIVKAFTEGYSYSNEKKAAVPIDGLNIGWGSPQTNRITYLN